MTFFISSKSVPSSAGKASSGVSERMSKNAGHNSAPKTGKGKFGAALQAIAKKRSGHLQHGVPHHAPLGGKVPFGSAVTSGPGLNVQATPGQAALNDEQE